MQDSSSDPHAARSVALDLIGQVQAGGLLTDSAPVLSALPPAERARAQRLATSTCRWMDRADRMLGPYLRLKPSDPVLNILRLGVVELAVDGAAAHGVTSGLVEICRSRSNKGSKAPGLVNAVLRRAAKDLGRWSDLPVPRLPKPLRKRLVAAYGKHAVAAVEAAHAAGAPLDLTPKRDDLSLPGATRLPTGSLRLTARGQVSTLPGFDDGDWWVQDAAAALPARILGPQPEERVLDLCAAPGGKTMQLAASGARVTALDASKARSARISENLTRTGLTAEILVADALTFQAAPFDAVLLDAPCSATGTIRRHPDLPLAKVGLDFAELIELQANMLRAALALTRPGGRLVYCTCSLLPEEGEAQIETLLAERPDLACDTNALRLPGIDPSWIGPQGLRLRPDYWADLGGMDGFFIALLRKPSSPYSEPSQPGLGNQRLTGASKSA